MSDQEEKKSKESQDSRTINIEIPAGGFGTMFRLMMGRGSMNKAGSGCCESSREGCCPPSGKDESQEIKIVIKKKEN